MGKYKPGSWNASDEYARQRALENEQLIRDTIRALAEAIADDGASWNWSGYHFGIRPCTHGPQFTGQNNPDAVETHLLDLLKTEE
jgi:hypothetical protein